MEVAHRVIDGLTREEQSNMKSFRPRVRCIALVTLLLPAAACHHESEPPARYYQLKGISVDKDHQQIIVSHDAIPGFMSAMTMPYEVKGDGVLDELAPGDEIAARVAVTPDDVWLDNIVSIKSGASPQPTVERHIPDRDELVPNFACINQDGSRIQFRSLRVKTVLLTFIYTRCPFPNYCPRMTGNFADISKALQPNKTFGRRTHLLTLSFDPRHDTSRVLKA
jgi:protein SCO1